MSNIKRYNGTSWEKIPIMADKATADVYGNDISTTYAKKADIYTKTETDTKLSEKQNSLVSGTNIKTINGSSILGSGNITISASVPTASSTTLGGIKIGHVNGGMVPVDYPVELDSENKAYVSVPIYGYNGTTYGDCYAIDSPNDDYSMQIGSSGFTVDVGDTVEADSNLLIVNSNEFTYNGNQVITSGNLKTINGNSLVGSGNISVTASVSKATTSTIGGIKAANVRSSAVTTTQGSSQHLYGVELDSNGKAFVNVPWTDTTYPNALNVDSTSSSHFYGYRYNNNNWGIEIYSGSVGNFPSIGPGGYSQKNVSVPFTHSSGESKYFLVVRGAKALIVRLVSKSSNGFTVLLYNPESSSTIANDIYVDWIGVQTW